MGLSKIETTFGEGNKKKNEGNIFSKFYQAEKSLKIRKRHIAKQCYSFVFIMKVH